jgi:[acyl-carrier-protein] S-malonyltransferase
VLGLAAAQVVDVCAAVPGFIEAANFNAPGQVVIGGDVEPVREASDRLRAAGARRVIPLAVSAPFHTSLMRPAADRLAAVLAGVEVREARLPVVANVSAAAVRTPDQIRRALVEQVASAVRWEESVQTLRAMGAEVFVEVGPGTTLGGMVKKTVPGARVVSVENQTTLEQALPAIAALTARDRGAAQVS